MGRIDRIGFNKDENLNFLQSPIFILFILNILLSCQFRLEVFQTGS